jgi:serine/threonine protein phosphatase PrpC
MMSTEREITAPLDAAALRAGWAAKGEAQPRLHARLVVGARTDMGRVRENNEDKFDFLEPDEPAVLANKGRIYAVADGMGGHQAGQIAAELALKTVFRAYYADAGARDIGASLTQAVAEANRYLLDVARMIPERSGMGTTLTSVVVREDELFVAQVGDSRCYLLRGGQMQQVTEDHSWVQEQVNRGVMSLEEAESSPFRNVITRSLGAAPEVEPDLFAIHLQPGDRVLLCSDGLSGMIAEAELFSLAREGSPSVAAWNLVDRALENGGKDNVTVLVLDVHGVVPWSDEEGGSPRTEAGPQTSDGRVEPGAVPEGAAKEPEPEGNLAPEGSSGTPGVWGRASGLFRRKGLPER